MSRVEIDLADATATENLGAAIAKKFMTAGKARADNAVSIHLQGELGAGKTTLAQGLLRAMGVTGTIRSPSYTLLEPYETAHGTVLHVDLYRINAAHELEALGLLDEAAHAALLLIEWPERAAGLLPPPSLQIQLRHNAAGRRAAIVADASWEKF